MSKRNMRTPQTHTHSLFPSHKTQKEEKEKIKKKKNHPTACASQNSRTFSSKFPSLPKRISSSSSSSLCFFALVLLFFFSGHVTTCTTHPPNKRHPPHCQQRLQELAWSNLLTHSSKPL